MPTLCDTPHIRQHSNAFWPEQAQPYTQQNMPNKSLPASRKSWTAGDRTQRCHVHHRSLDPEDSRDWCRPVGPRLRPFLLCWPSCSVDSIHYRTWLLAQRVEPDTQPTQRWSPGSAAPTMHQSVTRLWDSSHVFHLCQAVVLWSLFQCALITNTMMSCTAYHTNGHVSSKPQWVLSGAASYAQLAPKCCSSSGMHSCSCSDLMYVCTAGSSIVSVLALFCKRHEFSMNPQRCTPQQIVMHFVTSPLLLLHSLPYTRAAGPASWKQQHTWCLSPQLWRLQQTNCTNRVA